MPSSTGGRASPKTCETPSTRTRPGRRRRRRTPRCAGASAVAVRAHVVTPARDARMRSLVAEAAGRDRVEALVGEDLVEQPEVVDARAGRSLLGRRRRRRRCRPTVFRPRRSGRGDGAARSRRGRAPSASSGLPPAASSAALTAVLAVVGVAVDPARPRRTWPRAAPRPCPGTSRRNSVRTIRCVVTNSPSGHRSFSSTSTWPPPSRTSREAQGSGTQAPSSLPALNRLRRREFVRRRDR